MANAEGEKLNAIINHKTELDNEITFREWFLRQFETDAASNSCTLEDFALYFLNTLRQCTEVHLKPSLTETTNCETPMKIIKTYDDKEDSSTPKRLILDLAEQNVSTPNDKNFSSMCNSYCDASADCFNTSQSNVGSTPVRRIVSNNNSRRLSTTPNSANKSTSSSHSVCLGDFIVKHNATNNNKSQKEKKKTVSSTNPQNVQQTITEKPKKRLQPISISKTPNPANSSSIFAGESSFSNENNILKISNTELEDKDQCAILAARKSLKLNANEITKELQNISLSSLPVSADVPTPTTSISEPLQTDTRLDLKSLENNIPLKRLAAVYTIIIDLNLTTNILNELSFLLNLLNTPNVSNGENEISENSKSNNTTNKSEGLECLDDISYAVYFAVLCLTYEKENLALLDTKSLSVVLIGERFSYLPDDVKTYLLEAYQRKQQSVSEKHFSHTSTGFDVQTCSNVYFQQERDSRENFTSQHEFAKFRSQRDLFCKCFKIWETNHLNPMWKFSVEITPKIRNIFEQSENCINMAHLAKLFVSQLLLSALNSASPEEIGLDVDIEKFSKLSQRFIAPSQFSVDYQFPRSEAFFRDFILVSRSVTFIEQLKIALYTELISKTDTSFDYINLSKTDNQTDDQSLPLTDNIDFEYVIIRPDILNSMLILGKFLGFTIALPYNMNSSNIIPPLIEKNQISLRSLMQSTFDICAILEQGLQQNKFLVTIPWLVQYLAVLDNITLQLDNYMKTLKLMFALYAYLGLEENRKRFNSTFLFIIKLCLGWLFESKQFIAEQYYSYRCIFYEQNAKDDTKEMAFVQNILRRNVQVNSEFKNNVLTAYLESILPTACPFLAEFRVSIMPATYAQTKNVSRSGRYRHMTTRIAELPSTSARLKGKKRNKSNKPDQLQNSLIQAFFQSQNSTVRNFIGFCIERCYKCVVKDGQVKYLLPAKAKADNLVNQISSNDYRSVYKSTMKIYNDAFIEAKTNWDNSIPDMLKKRVRIAIENFLPEETSSVLKSTYFLIIKKAAMKKISAWFYNNTVKENFFCSNIRDLANRISNAHRNIKVQASSQMIISKDSPCVSDVIDELQYWLHCSSIRVDRFEGSQPLIQMFSKMMAVFDNTLPTVCYNMLSVGIIQLVQCIIAKHYTQLTSEFTEAVCSVWLHPNMKIAMKIPTACNTCVYDSLITITYIESLGIETNSFNKLGCLLVCMIKKEIISLNYVNDRFVSLFKHEWHPHVLEEISKMIRTIAHETATVPQHKTLCDNNDNDTDDNDDIDKSNLFLDMLADLSRDVDFF